MNIRTPVRAGSFYEGSTASCRRHAEELVSSARLPDDLPETLYGGIVPHAGWMFSGPLAAETMVALSESRGLETVVLFGADHVGTVSRGEVFDSGLWRTPLGEVEIDEELAAEILQSDLCRANPDAHAHEHSLEVQLPLLQTINQNVKIVPVAVPPTEMAARIGREVAQAIAQTRPGAVIVGSTDLTHHGGHFGNPGGQGREGVRWAEENDRRMLRLIETLDADGVIPEARNRQNACGAGAISATIAAAKQLGASAARVLEYTNSYQILSRQLGQSNDDTTVGYASVVFA
ncbi:MAG: AmmeMemoRadiSam system protein B [Phycisphaerae bacterium]